MPERYIDPNSGAAPQPGGFAAAPVIADDDGPTDAAVADEVTVKQEEDADGKDSDDKDSDDKDADVRAHQHDERPRRGVPVVGKGKKDR